MSKTTVIHIRVTEEQKNKIEQKAEKAGISLSEYVRLVALRCEVEIERLVLPPK